MNVCDGAPVVIEPNGNHRSSLIWLHGLGETTNFWSDVFDIQRLRGMKIILPQSKKRFGSLGMIPAWFEGHGIVDKPGRENESEINEVCSYIHGLIEREIATGIQGTKVIVGGFGSGAALALYAGLTFPVTLGGIVVTKGWIIRREALSLRPAINRTTPIFNSRGTEDPKINPTDAIEYDLNLQTEDLTEPSCTGVTKLDATHAFINSCLHD
uniref:palmitoyl-protein hydrolase n=1 Tax=Panagrellus redivivus TaxID=6233 RepID=A0A7E4UP42_PANRE